MGKGLPKEWDCANLLEIADVYTGKKDANYATEDGDYPFFTCAFSPLKSPDYSFEGSVLILPGNGVNVGEVFYYSGKFEAYQRTYVVDKIKLNPKYLYYHFRQFWRIRGTSEQFGSATNYIKIGNFKSYDVEFPPLHEQQRIVAKLDSLFAHLEDTKKRLEKIPELLKQFRQAVLTKAVTGNLTEEWRESKGLEEWEYVSSSKIFEYITSGSRGWARYYNNTGNQLFVRITNMNYGTFKLDLSPEKLQFLKLENTNEGKRTLLKPRDILISITADVGMVSLIEDDFNYEGYVNQHVCLARPTKEINEKFLVYFLMSEKGFGQLKDMKRGATKAGLTLGDIKQININLPPLQEQTEIVRRVEGLFTKANVIEAQYKKLKEKIDQLPQAILAKAFKGELVEQLPTDGSAEELLKEIKALKLEMKKEK